MEALEQAHQKTLMEAYRRFPDQVTRLGFWWSDYKRNFRGQNPRGYPSSIGEEVVAKFVEMGVFIRVDPTKADSNLMCNPDILRHWEALKEGAKVSKEFDPDNTQEIPMSVFPYLDRLAAEMDSEKF